MVNFIRDYKTKDNAIVRVYVVAFTIGRINSSRKHEIRLAADGILKERASSLFYEQFAQEAVKQNLARELYDTSKEIAKIRHLGIRKIKLIKPGEGMPYVPLTTEEEESPEDEEGELEEMEEVEKPITPAAA
jgi:small subunit ribosomal protein S3Ae